MIYPLKTNKRSPGFDSHRSHFSDVSGRKREISVKNHDKRTLDQRVGSGVYHYKRTDDLKKKDLTEGKPGAG